MLNSEVWISRQWDNLVATAPGLETGWIRQVTLTYFFTGPVVTSADDYPLEGI